MPDHFYVYPAYLSRDRTRAEGRRLPTATVLKDVTVEEIVQAAKRLGYRADAEAGKQYSRDVPSYAGRVKVTKRAGVTKTAFLRAVAVELARVRAQGAAR